MDPRFIRSMLCIKLIERNRRRIQTLAYIFRGDPQIHTGFLARPKRFLGIEAEKLYLVVVGLVPERNLDRGERPQAERS